MSIQHIVHTYCHPRSFLYIQPDISSQVWSTELDSATRKSGKHNIFDPKKSSTYAKASGSTWKIKYGDGSTASGIVGTDNVTLGGLCIEGQSIELASKLSAQFTKGAGDGLLGLAFGKINTVKPKPVSTPVESMYVFLNIVAELCAAVLSTSATS